MLFQFKQQPVDFIVDEQLGKMERSEKGSIRYIQFRKTDQNTMDIVAHLCKGSGLNRRQIGVAGLKDKKAITTQRFSIDMRDVSRQGGQEKIKNILSEKVEIIQQKYHDRMLGVGRNLGNKFTIRLRKKKAITPEMIEQIEKKIEQVADQGFPNCFGEQRFGKRNLARAFKFFEQGKSLRNDDFELKFKLQSFPSIYFNTQALQRYNAGDHLLQGDILARRVDLWTREVGVYDEKSDQVTVFDYKKTKEYHIDKDMCYPDFCESQTRPYNKEWSPTGLMLGANMLLCPNNTPARSYDRSLIKEAQMLDKAPTARKYHLFGIRRELITKPSDISRSREDGDLLISFGLPTGSYATVLLGWVFRDIDTNTCIQNKRQIKTIEGLSKEG